MFFSEEAQVHMGRLKIFCDLDTSDGDKGGMKSILDRIDKDLTENFFEKA